MRINKYFKYLTVPALFGSFMLTSCNNDDNPDSPYVSTGKEKTILLYAIASNNLSGNLVSDKNEILSVASQFDLDKCRLLVYEVTPAYEPALLELQKNADSYEFKKLKDYSTDISSATTERISEVINDVKEMGESQTYGLILWSHGTGLDYYPEENSIKSMQMDATTKDGVAAYAFGYDQNPFTGKIGEINIDVLADAIPDGLFSFIWFDACYMSGIETIYELRNKCNYYVGYPTEVFEWGMPYDLVMPHLMKRNSDLKGGAEAFFNYYANHVNSYARVATIALVDMSQIENVASLCKEAYSADNAVYVPDLQRYTRGNIGPFYDFNGYTFQKAGAESLDSFSSRWEKALDDFIIYKATTDYDFNYNPIKVEQFSGISCHIYNPDSTTDNDKFYRRLDWFKRVY